MTRRGSSDRLIDQSVIDYGRIAVSQLSVAVWIFDIDEGRVVWANRSGLAVWGADDVASLAARNMKADMSASVARRLKQYQDDFSRGHPFFSELWTIYPKGVSRTVRCLFSGFMLSDGRMGMLCEARDELEVEPDTLRSADALLHTQLMISLYSTTGVALYRNPSARSAIVRGRNDLASRFVDPACFQAISDGLKQSGEISRVVKIKTYKGLRWHDLTARECRDAVTGMAAILVSEVDVTELKETEAKAYFLAHHDSLTSLPNRASIPLYFDQCIKNAEAEGVSLGVLFLDLDNFKLINDSLGHASGDQVLMEVARRLVDVDPQRCTVIRLGGDEFLIIVSAGDLDAFEDRANQILQALTSPITIGKRKLTVTPSIGISVFPQDGRDFATLMKSADLAMYDAKESGRNCFRLFSMNMREQADRRLSMQSDVKAAITNKEFEIYYQPRVSLRDVKIVGAEALVRWNHPDRGLIPPSVFIPVCEESGLIDELGTMVMQVAMSQQKLWHDRGLPLTISINVSQRQLNNCNFVETVAHTLDGAGCDPSLIEFELTESMLMEKNDSSTNVIDSLRELGIKISIDDFGTGYSNLARLHEFAIDSVKIDRAFVKDLPTETALAEIIISLCKMMKVRIIAEGVERLEQLIWLRSRGCDEFQGFYFSKPIQVKAFEQMLELRSPSMPRAG